MCITTFNDWFLFNWHNTPWDQDKTNSDMTQIGKLAKYQTINCQVVLIDWSDNGCMSGQKKEKLYLNDDGCWKSVFFRKDSHINVTEILIKCFWNFLKDFVNKGPLMSDFFLFKWKLCTYTHRGGATAIYIFVGLLALRVL